MSLYEIYLDASVSDETSSSIEWGWHGKYPDRETALLLLFQALQDLVSRIDEHHTAQWFEEHGKDSDEQRRRREREPWRLRYGTISVGLDREPPLA